MNLCFLMGKIMSNIEFDFMLESNYISIATFDLLLKNNSLIQVKAYDEIADWCYRNLVKNDKIALQGELDSKMEIILHDINYL